MYKVLKKIVGMPMFFLLILTSCEEKGKGQDNKLTVVKETADESSHGLANVYRDYFPIGVAVNPFAITDSTTAAFILDNFSSMTPENVMKMGEIHPKEFEYNWTEADRIANFARKNNMKLRGHALVWHNQTGNWIFKDEDGGKVSKTVLLQRLKNHITTVMGRYKDVIYAWDVVNEAISDNPDEFLRNSEWYQICGIDYIIKAFEYAREADPNVQLFYNDYSALKPDKRDKIIKLIGMLQDAGVAIDGMGVQCHVSIYEPTELELKEALNKYIAAGVTVQITELDVSVYPKEHQAREHMPKDDNAVFTTEQDSLQAQKYKMLFRVFREYEKHISGVTFWNVSDRYSWLDNFPVPNRKDYPLVFDAKLQPKKAYYEITSF